MSCLGTIGTQAVKLRDSEFQNDNLGFRLVFYVNNNYQKGRRSGTIGMVYAVVTTCLGYVPVWYTSQTKIICYYLPFRT